MTRLDDNAVFAFDAKMKTKKKSSVILLSVISGIVMLIVTLAIAIAADTDASANGFAETGTVLYYIVSAMHFVMLVFITPAITASSISSEKERQTYDLLVCTQMTPADLVIGKYFSCVGWLTLVSISAFPAYMVIMLLGGVTVKAVLFTFIFNIWISAVIAAISIMFSSVINRSAGAVIISYLVLFGIESVNFILFGIRELVRSAMMMNGYVYPLTTNLSHIFYLNPVMAYVLVLAGGMNGFEEAGKLVFSCELYEVILTIAINFVVYSLVAFFAIKIAIKKVNPLKEKKDKIRK